MHWIIFVILVFSQTLFSSDSVILKKIHRGCPEWMMQQIEEDLAPYRSNPISLAFCEKKYAEFIPDHYVLKFSIRNNQLSWINPSSEPGVAYRAASLVDALKDLCRLIQLPDVTFYITMHDGVMQANLFSPHFIDFPIFSMSRLTVDQSAERSILVPDFDALYEKYQVIKGKDVRYFEIPWLKKRPQLIWRGSTAQCSLDLSSFPHLSSNNMTKETAYLFTRFVLCEQSRMYPELINAKYTYLVNLEKTFPYVETLQGSFVPYIEQFKYKYHIIINGNAASYTNSCWKLFSNSVIFIPESYWFQWYYKALKPYEHCIPVDRTLDDLPEKILWAIEHDKECERIARNAREFALQNLTRADHIVYLYYLLNKYSELTIE